MIEYIHDEQILKYGGRLGFHRDPSLLDEISALARGCEGDTYQKAAFLLRSLITAHVFKDGQHRTAFVVTSLFLRENGKEIRCNNYSQARTFLKDIRAHDLDEIARWLKYGDPRGKEESRPDNAEA